MIHFHDFYKTFFVILHMQTSCERLSFYPSRCALFQLYSLGFYSLTTLNQAAVCFFCRIHNQSYFLPFTPYHTTLATLKSTHMNSTLFLFPSKSTCKWLILHLFCIRILLFDGNELKLLHFVRLIIALPSRILFRFLLTELHLAVSVCS